jgi:hypothetical protein
MGDLSEKIKGGDRPTALTPDEYLIIKNELEKVPEESRNSTWIIHGISQKDGTMKDIDLDSRDFNHLHGIIKKVYQTLRDKNKFISEEQEGGMYNIMLSRAPRGAQQNEGGNMYGMQGGGYMNGARKKSKRRKSKRRKSKKRKSRRKSKRRS